MAPSTLDTPPPASLAKSRRRLLIFTVGLLVLAGGWQGLKRFIDIEHYRPIIDAQLENLIKLPLEFEAMDLRLFPTPRLVVENVTAGEGDFSVFAPEVSVSASLWQLLRGRLALQTVSIQEARLKMPESREAFLARWGSYLNTLGAPREVSGKAGPQVSLARIDVPDLTVTSGQDELIRGTLHVLKVTAGAPEFNFEIEGLKKHANTTAHGSLILDIHSEPRLHGTADLSGLRLGDLTGDPALPPLLLDGKATFSLAREPVFTVETEGRVRLPDQADPLGPFHATLHRAEDMLRIVDLHVKTAPLSLDASLEVFDDKRWNLAIDQATLHDQGVAWLAARVPAIPARAGGASEVSLAKARLGAEAPGVFSFSEGQINVSDLTLALNDGYHIDGIHGAINVQKDSYALSDFTNGHIESAGTMTVDYLTDTVALNLSGRLILSPNFPLPQALVGALHTDGGTIAIPAFQATFAQGQVQLPSLHIEAASESCSVSVFDRSSGMFTSPIVIAGEARFEDGALQVERIQGPHSKISGTLTPDETLQQWTVSSSFTSDLSSPLWEFLQPAAVSLRGGKMECTRLDGVFVRGSKTPEALMVEASLKDVEAVVESGAFKDVLKLPSVAVTSTMTEVTYDAQGVSERFGPFTAKGTYAPEGSKVEAETRLRLAESSALPEEWREGISGTLLQALSDVPLRLYYGGPGTSLEITSDAPLSMKGTVTFSTAPAAGAPVGIALNAAIPVAWLAPYLSERIAPIGAVSLEGKLNAVDGRISLLADMTDAALGWSVLEKKVGFPMVLAFEGVWTGGRGRIAGGQLAAGGEHVNFVLRDGTLGVEKFDVDLGPLLPLLPEGAALVGRVSGSYAGDKNALALNFDGVHAQVSPALLPVAVDGGLEHRGAFWQAEEIAWAVGTSQGTLQLKKTSDNWQGSLQAQRIDASELRKGYLDWATYRGEAPQDGTPPWNFDGDVAIAIDTLVWADAIMDNTRGQVHFSPGQLEARELVIHHGVGEITGEVTYVSARDGNPATAGTNLRVSDVDAVLLEGLFLEKARGLAGLMKGQVHLTIPLIPDSRSLMNDLSGEILVEASDGTLGKAGIASKLLGALRTTDILRLRVPQLKDQGLSFKTLTGKVVIVDGVFQIEPFSLSDSAYVLETTATLNYPKDTADGSGEIQVLEGVTGIARKIPILGEAANLVSKVFAVPFRVSGTARDPAFGMGGASSVKEGKGK